MSSPTTELISISPDHSTTRLITRKLPVIEKQPTDTFETVLFFPKGEGRQGEGGLRTQGYFKSSLIDQPLITVITAVFNGVKYIEETILSIINQTYSNVEYIIIDGGSNDGTQQIIQKHDNAIDYWISENDSGLYDALAKAFTLSTGSLILYINAGDLLYIDSLRAVADTFKKNPHIDWVTGYRSVCNEESIITRIEAPTRYTQSLIQKGVYGKYLPYIQQESTVWRSKLLKSVDLQKLGELTLAGDYYLWIIFSNKTNLHVIKTPIGIFKRHKNQLSHNIAQYWVEVGKISYRKTLLTPIEIIIEACFWIINPMLIGKLLNHEKN